MAREYWMENEYFAFWASNREFAKSAILMLRDFFTFIGKVSCFGLKALVGAFQPPLEWEFFLGQIEEIGWRSLPLILAAGFALGVVMSMHTRGTLVQFGAEAMIPTLQSGAFFNELGPLVTALLVAGRVGAAIGAGLTNMRVTEQIDAIESLSVDSFKMLVVTRIVACILVLPLLTVFMDFASLAGGFFSEHFTSHISLQLYMSSAFKTVEWANFIPPTLKTSVFGFIIGTVSGYFGYTTNEGSQGVQRAATNSVVLSSLLIIVVDVILVKVIFFLFPGQAI
jgi:phospholipid/cholesterol/gamma-HCH transport system permease protein